MTDDSLKSGPEKPVPAILALTDRRIKNRGQIVKL